MNEDNVYQRLIKEVRDLAHEAGYYQATLEKCELTEKERAEYTELNRKVVARRNQIHGDLLSHISNNFFVRRNCQP